MAPLLDVGVLCSQWGCPGLSLAGHGRPRETLSFFCVASCGCGVWAISEAWKVEEKVQVQGLTDPTLESEAVSVLSVLVATWHLEQNLELDIFA